MFGIVIHHSSVFVLFSSTPPITAACSSVRGRCFIYACAVNAALTGVPALSGAAVEPPRGSLLSVTHKQSCWRSVVSVAKVAYIPQSAAERGMIRYNNSVAALFLWRCVAHRHFHQEFHNKRAESIVVKSDVSSQSS